MAQRDFLLDVDTQRTLGLDDGAPQVPDEPARAKLASTVMLLRDRALWKSLAEDPDSVDDIVEELLRLRVERVVPGGGLLWVGEPNVGRVRPGDGRPAPAGVAFVEDLEQVRPHEVGDVGHVLLLLRPDRPVTSTEGIERTRRRHRSNPAATAGKLTVWLGTGSALRRRRPRPVWSHS